MKAPYLQIALDNESLEDAFHTLRGGLGNEVDIIEVGTMLILMEGVRAARIMRACFPDKIMVADAALSVAHFGPKVLAAGTQFVTMFSPARNEVKAAILAQAKEANLYDGWYKDAVELGKSENAQELTLG